MNRIQLLTITQEILQSAERAQTISTGLLAVIRAIESGEIKSIQAICYDASIAIDDAKKIFGNIAHMARELESKEAGDEMVRRENSRPISAPADEPIGNDEIRDLLMSEELLE